MSEDHEMEPPKTNIQISRETHRLLGEMGRKGQTYDDVVRDLIAFADLTIIEFWKFQRGSP